MRITRRSNDARAGATYAVSVFVVGFALGTLRVLVVAPRLGDTVAVTLEAPVMLLASWEFSRRLIKRFDVPAQARAIIRIAVGRHNARSQLCALHCCPLFLHRI